MFRPPRQLLRPLALVALGFLLAAMITGNGGGVIGAILFLPFLILKMLFFFLLIGFLMKVAFGGRGPWSRGPRRSPWRGGPWGPRGWAHGPRGRWDDRDERSGDRWGTEPPRRDDGSRWWYRDQPMSAPRPPAPRPSTEPEQRDWEESLRRARAEVDDIDRRSAH